MHRRSSKSYSSRNSKIPERSKIPDCVIASNKSAEYNYFLDKTFEAGLVLLGSEVKSVRQQKISLSEAYIYEDNSEIWLANLYIPEHKTGDGPIIIPGDSENYCYTSTKLHVYEKIY